MCRGIWRVGDTQNTVLAFFPFGMDMVESLYSLYFGFT